MTIRINKVKIWFFFVICLSIVPVSIPGLEVGALQLLFLGSLFYLVLSQRGRLLYYFSIPLICWIFIFVWGLISILWCKYPASAFHHSLYNFYFCASILLVSFAAKDYNLQLFGMKVYLLVGTCLAIVGFYESFTGNILNVAYEQYQNYKNFLGLSSPNTIFVNINDHAVFMAMCFMLAYLVSENSRHRKLMRIGSLILFCGNVLLVNSRGALLAILVFLFVYYWISVDFTRKVLYILIAAFGIIVFSGAISEFLNQTIFKEGMDLGRMWIWEESLKNLQNSYFIGVGAGNTSLVNYIVGWTEDKISVHNFALEIFCDYGIVGLVALFTCCLSMVKASIRRLRMDLGRYSGVIAILVAFIPLSIVVSSLIGKYWFYSFISLVISLIYFPAGQSKIDICNFKHINQMCKQYSKE